MKQRVLDRTESNMERLARRLKAVGIPGAQVLTIDGLDAAGGARDRETYFITGTKIIVPHRFFIPPIYNDLVVFGICLNQEGVDEDHWFDYVITTTQLVYQDPLPVIDRVLFNRITIRNYLPTVSPKIKIWIFQDPLWIDQVNAIVKDITP